MTGETVQNERAAWIGSDMGEEGSGVLKEAGPSPASPQCAEQDYKMADVEQLLNQLRVEAVAKGAGWLQEQLATVLGTQHMVTGTGGESPHMRGGPGLQTTSRQTPPPELNATLGVPFGSLRAPPQSDMRCLQVGVPEGIPPTDGARGAGPQGPTERLPGLPSNWTRRE